MPRTKRKPVAPLIDVEPPILGAISNIFRGTPAEVAALFDQHGLESVQILPQFSNLSISSADDVTRSKMKDMGKPFKDLGLIIAGITASVNVVDPDNRRRKRQLAFAEKLIGMCRDAGARCVIMESGTLRPSRPWEDHPENHLPETLESLRKNLRPLVKLAESTGVMILLEPHLNHVVSSAEHALALRESLGEHLGFVMDPCNLFTRSLASASKKPLRALFQAIGEFCPVAHSKDIRYVGNERTTPRTGTGTLDYAEFLRCWAEYQPGGPMILEQITAAELDETVDFLDRMFGKG